MVPCAARSTKSRLVESWSEHRGEGGRRSARGDVGRRAGVEASGVDDALVVRQVPKRLDDADAARRAAQAWARRKRRSFVGHARSEEQLKASQGDAVLGVQEAKSADAVKAFARHVL